jgi:hypothetical protein
LIVGALVLGLVVGLIAVPRLFSGMDARAESYVVLASTLYQQGESPALLRERLTSVGIAQPASAVLATAQRYAASRDKKQQHQAEALEAFGKVLLNPEGAPALASPSLAASPPGTMTAGAATTVAPPTPAPVGTPGLGPPTLSTPIGARPTQASGFAGAPGTPAAAQPGLPPPGTPAPGATAPAAAPASPAPGASPPAAAGQIQRGRVKPVDGGPALLRKEPSRDGGTLSLIPNAAQVEVLETVRGQAVEGETRWLRVRYGNLTGYLWSKLVVVGD